MASGQIRMTPETMRGRASEYRIESENVQNVIEKMDSLLESLQAEWEGAASEAYAAKFGELRPSFVAAKDLLMILQMLLIKRQRQLKTQIMRLQDSLECNMPCLLKINRNI